MSKPGEPRPQVQHGDGGGAPPVPSRPRGTSARPALVVAAAAVALLLTAGAGIGGWLTMRDEPGQGSASTGQERDVAVFFCVVSSSTPNCGRRDAGQAEKDAVKQRLLEMNGIMTVRYESKEQAYENFKKAFADRKDLLDGASLGDIPDSLRLRVADAGVAGAVKKRFEGTSGVDTVVIQPPGKA